jgi:hypothetical protein
MRNKAIERLRNLKSLVNDNNILIITTKARAAQPAIAQELRAIGTGQDMGVIILEPGDEYVTIVTEQMMNAIGWQRITT